MHVLLITLPFQVYTPQFDIFSFAMFIYELITLDVPYIDLNAQLAKQATEKEERPSLKREVQLLYIIFSIMYKDNNYT